ncbi:hypothetical protein TrST_g1780 [Triparma strigata]|uniref:Uncharacterized protein n=1 Tax=Triparma strigata TaxID=1606541 RepID=A0A9W7C4D3_9STRA|nr:hypothetical protein TrST_g1780 [Triparma strigata]
MQASSVESTYQSFDTDRYSNISHSVRSPSRVTGFVYFESGNEDDSFQPGQGRNRTEDNFDDLADEGFSEDDEVVIDEMGEDGLDFSLKVSEEEKEEEGQDNSRSKRTKQAAESKRSHYMDPTFSSKMHESDVIVPDDVKEFRADDSLEEKAVKVKVKARVKKIEKEQDEDEIRPLETVEEFRNRMAGNSPPPKPKVDSEDEGIKEEVENKAASFLGSEGGGGAGANPPLPSEVWEMVKEGYEAKIAAAAREADRSARREERRKYREKSIASRLNDTSESIGGSSNAEPEVMVDRAVTRALAGDVEGAKVMLERKREQKFKREAIVTEKRRAQEAKKKRREARARKREAIERLKEKKERARRKKKSKKKKKKVESSSDSSSTSDTSDSDSTSDSLESSASSSDSSVEIPIVRSLSKSSKSIHDTINTVAKTLTSAIGDPISSHRAFHQTPLEAVTEVLPFVDEDGLLGAVDTDMLELRRIQSKLSYQLGRLSTTLNNVATAAKASEKVGHEKAFLLGRTGRSEAERVHKNLKRNPNLPVAQAKEEEDEEVEEKKEGRMSPDSLGGVYDTLQGREDRARDAVREQLQLEDEERRRAYELQRRAHEEEMHQQQLMMEQERKRQEQMYVPPQAHQQAQAAPPPNTSKLQNLTKRIYANTGSTAPSSAGPVNSYPFSAPNTSLSSAYLLSQPPPLPNQAMSSAPPQIRTPTYPALQTTQRMTQDFTKPVMYPLKVRDVSIGGSGGGGGGGASVVGSQTGRQSPNFAIADNLMKGLDVQSQQSSLPDAGGDNFYVPPRDPVQIDPVKLVNTGTAAERVLRMMDNDGYRFSDAINENVKRND